MHPKLPPNIIPVTSKNVPTDVSTMIGNSQKCGNSLGQTAAMVFESHGLLIRRSAVKYIYDRVEYMSGREGTHGFGPVVESSSCDRLVEQLDDAGHRKIVLYHHNRTVQPDNGGILVSQSQVDNGINESLIDNLSPDELQEMKLFAGKHR